MATQVSRIHFRRTRIPFTGGGMKKREPGDIVYRLQAIILSILIVSLKLYPERITVEKIKKRLFSVWKTSDVRFLRKFRNRRRESDIRHARIIHRLRLRVHTRIYAQNYVSSGIHYVHVQYRHPELLCKNLSLPPPPFAGRSVARNGCKTYAAWSILYLIRSRTYTYIKAHTTYTHTCNRGCLEVSVHSWQYTSLVEMEMESLLPCGPGLVSCVSTV